MADRWDLPLTLLTMMMLLRTISSQHTTFDPLDAVTLLGSPTEGFVLVPEDYGDLDYTTTLPVPVVPSGKRCDYKPCLDEQPSCFELSRTLGCLCPGFTHQDVPPLAPDLNSVTFNGSEVVVRWCEPLSDVLEYVLTLGGQEVRRFGRDKRSASVGRVDNVVQVCVSAVNRAGRGAASCSMYRPEDGGGALAVGLGVGGALAALLVLLLVGVACRRRRQRKREADISGVL